MRIFLSRIPKRIAYNSENIVLVQMHVCVYVRVCACAHAIVFMCTWVHVRLWGHVCNFVCVRMWACACVRVCLQMHQRATVCVCVSAYIEWDCVSVSKCEREWVRVWVHASVWVGASVWLGVSVSRCEREWVRVWMRSSVSPLECDCLRIQGWVRALASVSTCAY